MEKVTIVMPTYNLEEYIEEALDSVFMQKTNFDFKIIIADDASTDNTVKIIETYMNKHPGKIELLLSNQNGGVLKNSNRAFMNIKSDYLALLDGDDYWITDDYLQKHVDFLENNLEYTMCGANTIKLINGSPDGKIVPDDSAGQTYDFDGYLNGKCPFVHTSSILLRNVVFINGLPNEFVNVEDTFENCACRGENFRFLLHLERGKLMVRSEAVSCYRIHKRGIWQGASEANHLLIGAITNNFFDKYWSNLNSSFFHNQFLYYYRNFMSYMVNEGKICEKYSLNEYDTFMLIGLLEDLSKRDINWFYRPHKVNRAKVLFDYFLGKMSRVKRKFIQS